MNAKPEARVLAVDDEQQIRRLVSVLLRRIDGDYVVTVTEAGSAEEAAALLETQTFDLVVSDHSMPGKTGIDLLEGVHRKFPRTGRMLITALAQLDIGVDAINRGHVDAFLRKPFDNDAFVALVDSLLKPRVQGRTAPAPAPRVPAAIGGAAPAAQSAAKTAERAKLKAEMDEIEKQLKTIRVRLGLGALSADGYAKLNESLSKKRAELEVKLLDLEL